MNKKNNELLIIGSHVSMCAPHFFLGSVQEALSYEANALMIYTGAPQNTIRKDVNTLKIEAGLELLATQQIPTKNLIIHAPYIINLCSDKLETRMLATKFLEQELIRTAAFKAQYLVLHPGSRLSQSENEGLEQIILGINEVLSKVKNDVVICLETMAGKGSELGYSFKQLKFIIDNIKDKKRIGVCLDTCHINDAGYDLSNADEIVETFDKEIGLDYLKVIHINDSKNPKGTRKDRHENLGYGYIGFEKIANLVHHPKLINIPKILETPWVIINEKTKKSLPIYKEEIQMLREQKYFDAKSKIKEK